MLPDLKGKVVIVTGGSSGIGLATAKILIGAEAKVLACDVAPEPVDDAIKTSNFKFIQINLIEKGAAKKVVDACVEAFGDRIDGLCNVAGVMDLNASADTLTDATWDRVMDINTKAPVYLMREVLPYMMKAKCGSIVNVASKAGTSGASAGIAYTASKHALVGATKNVAWRFVEDGIRCNVVCPGAVATNMENTIDYNKADPVAMERLRPIASLHMGEDLRTGQIQAKDVAQTIVFLVSDMSSKISGALLPIDLAWSVI